MKVWVIEAHGKQGVQSYFAGYGWCQHAQNAVWFVREHDAATAVQVISPPTRGRFYRLVLKANAVEVSP